MSPSEGFKIEMVDVNAVDEATFNPRRITPQHLEKLKGSLREFGFVDPAIANKRTGRLVGGHMRRRAWIELGNTTMPVVYVDLGEDEEKALNVALNNAELAGEWDLTKLVPLLSHLSSSTALLDSTGFDPHTVKRFQRQLEAKSAPAPVYPITPKLMEHYDYVVIFTTNEMDWVRLKQLLQIRTERSYKKQKKGIGRVVPFREFLNAIEGRERGDDAPAVEVAGQADQTDEGRRGSADAPEVPGAAGGGQPDQSGHEAGAHGPGAGRRARGPARSDRSG